MKVKSQLIIVTLFIQIFFISCTAVKIQQSYKRPMLEKESIKKINTYTIAENQLFGKADRLINKKFKSIIDKDVIPPSGDRHDYISRAIYYWPDSTSESKKWKYIDGKVNKKSLEETDHFTFFEAMGAIRDLSLAFHLSNNEKYAKKTFRIIDQWFVNNKTKMNPNFKFSQAIPGKNDGSHWGIISSRAVIWVINGINLLKSSTSFSTDIYEGFQNWCADFLEWLTKSEFGQKEGSTKNNHATFYALQVTELADFTGEVEICFAGLNRVKDILIQEQIRKDGSMPEELKRSKPLYYSLFNMSAFFHLAMLGDKYNIDLWYSKSDSSGSTIEAFDFILAELNKVKNKKNVEINYSYLIGLVTTANKIFDGKYKAKLNEFLSYNYKMRLVDSYFVF